MSECAVRRLVVKYWSPFPLPYTVLLNANKGGGVNRQANAAWGPLQISKYELPIGPTLHVSAFSETAYGMGMGISNEMLVSML